MELCPHYRLVDERPGGWVAETQRLNAELAARGKKTVGGGSGRACTGSPGKHRGRRCGVRACERAHCAASRH